MLYPLCLLKANPVFGGVLIGSSHSTAVLLNFITPIDRRVSQNAQIE